MSSSCVVSSSLSSVLLVFHNRDGKSINSVPDDGHDNRFQSWAGGESGVKRLRANGAFVGRLLAYHAAVANHVIGQYDGSGPRQLQRQTQILHVARLIRVDKN